MLPLETTFVLRDGVHENVLHVVNPTRSFALLGGNADIVKRFLFLFICLFVCGN